MRPSSRQVVVDAALEIARRDGVAAVTFDAVSQEANLSRGGIIYHFPSKDELLIAMVERIAEVWEEELLAALDRPWFESTPVQRVKAYLQVAVGSTAQSDIAMMIDPAVPFDGEHPIQRVVRRWVPSAAEATDSEAAFEYYLIRLAADGLWLHSALDIEPFDPDLQDRIVDRLCGN
ncbi:MAG: TetR/AcrR family transcriptional regulator [Microthrixaceae bacterium]